MLSIKQYLATLLANGFLHQSELAIEVPRGLLQSAIPSHSCTTSADSSGQHQWPTYHYRSLHRRRIFRMHEHSQHRQLTFELRHPHIHQVLRQPGRPLPSCLDHGLELCCKLTAYICATHLYRLSTRRAHVAALQGLAPIAPFVFERPCA